MKVLRIAAIGFISLSLLGCKRDLERQLGPNFCSVIEENLSVSATNVDFTNGLNLKAKVSGNLDWKIILRGKSSHAIKRYSGNSANIDIVWNGETDTTTFFHANEDCEIEFVSNCQSSQYKTVHLTANPDYSKWGYLLDDFEGGGLANPFVNNPSAINGLITNADAPQGSKYYTINDVATSWAGVGNVSFPIPSNSIASKLQTTDASNIYVNFFVNTNGSTSNTVSLRVMGPGFPQASSTIKINDFKAGWNFRSIKLSDIIDKKDVNLITQLQFDPGALTSTAHVYMSLDFIMLTKGKPLQ